MKAIKIVVIILVVLALLLAAGLFAANRYLQTPAFKETVLGAARNALGADVQIRDFQASLFSGVNLREVRIANPTGFSGDLLKADAFVLRYRLLPLLRGRVEIEQLKLESPVITLARNAQDEWNYDKLGGSAPPPSATAPPAASASSSVPPRAPLDVTLSKLALTGGQFLIVNETGKELVRVDNINLATSASLADGKLSGAGAATLDTLAVANALFARHVTAPVTISSEAVKLAPLAGALADGKIAGEVTLELAGGTRFAVALNVQDAALPKLLAEAGVTKEVMTGKLQLTTTLWGAGGLPTMAGHGRAAIAGGQVMSIPLLEMVATLLQIHALRDLKFSECVMEFTITNNVMQTPLIRLVAPDVQITGKGAVSLADYSLNHTLTLAFTTNALSATPKEVRSLFAARPDGMLALDFKVWGPYDAPKTDLKERLIGGAAEQLLQKLLK